MLRAGIQATGVDLDLRTVGNRSHPSARDDAAALLRFTDALIGQTDDLDPARQHLTAVIGPDAVAPAAATAGNFEMMNRLVDAAGVSVPAALAAIAPEIGLPADNDD